MIGTEGYFKDRILEVDALAEVDFDSIPYGIKIRPSHPRYFDRICRVAWEQKTMGTRLIIMREVEYEVPTTYEYLWPKMPPPIKKKSWWKRLHEKLNEVLG